jgi:hypothetical protein
MNEFESRGDRPQSYVGVSGFVDVVQQLHFEKMATEMGFFDTGRLLAYGVKATHKAQFDDTENKYGKEWYPVGAESFAKALVPQREDSPTMGVAQIYLEKSRVGSSSYRDEFVERIAERGKRWLQAMQFDMLPWHDNEELLRFVADVREQYEVKTLLQVHGPAMEALGPKNTIKKLGRYAGGIDYVLFDASHGTGARMDTKRLGNFLNEAYSSSNMSNVGFAIAGGLNAENVGEDLPALVKKYHDLSWDAEGQLHPVNNVQKRPLFLPYAKDYLQASTEILS